MTAGIDYSWARPGGAAIKDAGYDFVMRYVPYPGDGGKGLTADELADLRAHDLAVGLVFESTAGRPLDGYGAGNADAKQCLRALEALGFPADRPMYFAVDFDATATQMELIDDYLNGCANALGVARVGVYGSYDVVKHCHEAGTATWLWQTYAWSGGRKYGPRNVYQWLNGQTLNGGAVDYNEAYGADYGAWGTQEASALKLTEAQTENLLLRLFAGKEFVASETRAQRLERALAELDKTDTVQSVNDTALSAIAVAQIAGGAGIVSGTTFTAVVA